MAVPLIVVWDSSADSSAQEGRIYLWNGHAGLGGGSRSLLQYVDEHAKRLRARYLAWIHELGESSIDGVRLVDHLALNGQLSYWWMTLLVEKSPWKSPAIVDVIRLLAMEEILVREQPARVRFVSANRRLHKALGDLCQSLGVQYEWRRAAPDEPRTLSLRRAFKWLPLSLLALAALIRHVWERWPLREAKTPGWFDGERTLFLCSYFGAMDSQAGEKGQYLSRYWEGLDTVLKREGLEANWLQLYFRHDAVPSVRVALERVRRFNEQKHEQGFHTFLDAYLSWGLIFRVTRHWVTLWKVHRRLGGIASAFRPPQSQLSLWPVMQEEWHRSMIGPPAVSNLLCIELFDAAMRDLPHQSKGVYLCENQGWERALVSAWRAHGHGALIAVAHATVRFWDLRYYSDVRTLRSSAPHPIPQADLTALNGKAAIDAYRSVDYPEDRIVDIEALRFSHLNALRTANTLRRHSRAGGVTKVLILGDYLPSGTIKMLRLLEEASPALEGRATYTMKPHPYFMVDAAQFPSLNLEMVADPLGQILHGFDIAYASNMTSAALDAYLAGIPVVVMLNETELNFSPLYLCSTVRFVSTPQQLVEALRTLPNDNAGPPDAKDFLFLDPALPRWSRLLAQ